jgi:hypothetical protein
MCVCVADPFSRSQCPALPHAPQMDGTAKENAGANGGGSAASTSTPTSTAVLDSVNSSKRSTLSRAPNHVGSNPAEDSPGGGRLKKFLHMLNRPILELEQLRTLSWSGIPAEVRPTVWKLLSGYLPANSDRRSAILERRRAEYRLSVDQHYPQRHDKAHAQMLHQIQVDVLRSTPCSLFAQEAAKQCFERLLFVFHVRHPGSG